MAKEIQDNYMLAALIRRSRLPWCWFTATVATVLILCFVLAALLDGVFTNLSEWEFLREFLIAPAVILYILLVYPLIWRL